MSRLQASFENMADARKAMKILKDMGYSNVHLDMDDRYGFEFSSELGSADVDDSGSLSAMVLQSPRPLWETSKAPLFAADPSSSGMSAYSAGYAGNTALSITADENQTGKIQAVIEENGGVLRIFKQRK